MELYLTPLSQVPIKQIPLSQQQPYIDLVDHILRIKNSKDYAVDSQKQKQVRDAEEQIDRMVCALYDLTKEEVGIMKSFKARD